MDELVEAATPVTCRGDCCVVFTLPLTAEQLSERHTSTLQDGDKLKAMLVPLTHEEARARARSLQTTGADFEPVPGTNYFTCVHWDEETRLCGDYEGRPAMCRDYPYDKDCDHCDYCPAKDIVERYRAQKTEKDNAGTDPVAADEAIPSA